MKGESNDYQHDMGRGMEIVNANDKTIVPPEIVSLCNFEGGVLTYIDNCI